MSRSAFIITITCLVCSINGEIDLITEPKPGEEYVLVSGGRGGANLFKNQKSFHDRITNRDIQISPYTDSFKRTNNEGIVAIEEGKQNYKKDGHKKTSHVEIDVPFSKFDDIKITENVREVEEGTNLPVVLETMSETGKLLNFDITTQKPVLTTAKQKPKTIDALPIEFESIDSINSGLLSVDFNLETAASEQKQHSRIQIKKGPNGKEYEYEYVYYYYDDDESNNGTSSTTTTTEPLHNGHDGPEKEHFDNSITTTKSKGAYVTIDRRTTTTALPEVNEIAPGSQSRNRNRGRNLTPAPVTEEAERLPGSTRFPPRSRNLQSSVDTTTEIIVPKQRFRIQTTESPAEDTPSQSKSRTRSNVRRPSLELVDLANFNTHAGDKAAPLRKDFVSRYSLEEGHRTDRTTERESISTSEKEEDAEEDTERQSHSIKSYPEQQSLFENNKATTEFKTTVTEQESTEYTTMTGMEKVALDLYAYLAGENLNNEISSADDYLVYDGSTTELLDSTTETFTTTEPTTTTIKATTTTTTLAPTTTTTTTPKPSPTPSTRASRFRNRNGAKTRQSSTTETTANIDTSTKGKARHRPSFGRGRTSTASPSTSIENTEEKEIKQEVHATHTKPLQSRNRFGSRPRSSTTATAHVSTEATASSEQVTSKPRLRPTFNLRSRSPLLGSSTTTTAAPSSPSAESDAAASESSPAEAPESSSPASKLTGRRLPAIRPLRPGPRLNLGRGNTVSSTATSASVSTIAPDTSSESHSPAEDQNSQTSETTPQNPLSRLRSRPRLNVAPSAKPKSTVAVPIRRSNVLLRRRPNVTEATEASESPDAPVTESLSDASSEGIASSDTVAETAAVPSEEPATEAPRGLSSLFARRRLNRRPGTKS